MGCILNFLTTGNFKLVILNIELVEHCNNDYECLSVICLIDMRTRFINCFEKKLFFSFGVSAISKFEYKFQTWNWRGSGLW